MRNPAKLGKRFPEVQIRKMPHFLNLVLSCAEPKLHFGFRSLLLVDLNHKSLCDTTVPGKGQGFSGRSPEYCSVSVFSALS